MGDSRVDPPVVSNGHSGTAKSAQDREDSPGPLCAGLGRHGRTSPSRSLPERSRAGAVGRREPRPPRGHPVSPRRVSGALDVGHRPRVDWSKRRAAEDPRSARSRHLDRRTQPHRGADAPLIGHRSAPERPLSRGLLVDLHRWSPPASPRDLHSILRADPGPARGGRDGPRDHLRRASSGARPSRGPGRAAGREPHLDVAGAARDPARSRPTATAHGPRSWAVFVVASVPASVNVVGRPIVADARGVVIGLATVIPGDSP